MSHSSHREWWSCSLSRASLSLVELGWSLPRVCIPSCTSGPEVATQLAAHLTHFSLLRTPAVSRGSARCPLTCLIPRSSILAVLLPFHLPQLLASCYNTPVMHLVHALASLYQHLASCPPCNAVIPLLAHPRAAGLPRTMCSLSPPVYPTPCGYCAPSSDVLRASPCYPPGLRCHALRVMCSPDSDMSALRRRIPAIHAPGLATS